MSKKKNNKIEFKFFNKKLDIIIFIVSMIIVVGVFCSPNIYWVTTAKWTKWNKGLSIIRKRIIEA